MKRALGIHGRGWVLGGALATLVVTALAVPPIPQDPAYHDLADRRALAGIPNALNVLSNLLIGLAGLAGLIVSRRAAAHGAFDDPWERWPYLALFTGAALTAIGSAWYHLAPDNARLVWDRLPMTIGFMGLLTAVVAERVDLALARRLFVGLLVLGAASVGYWHWSELQGAGDLRPYALVQFGSLVTIVLLLALYESRYSGTRYLVAGLTLYGAAKIFELADAAIFALGGVVSGHTLKHTAAAAAIGCVVQMIRVRAAALPRARRAAI